MQILRRSVKELPRVLFVMQLLQTLRDKIVWRRENEHKRRPMHCQILFHASQDLISRHLQARLCTCAFYLDELESIHRSQSKFFRALRATGKLPVGFEESKSTPFELLSVALPAFGLEGD